MLCWAGFINASRRQKHRSCLEFSIKLRFRIFDEIVEISVIGGPDRLKIVEFLILIENWDFEFPMRSQKFLPHSPHRSILGLHMQNYEHPENFKIWISENKLFGLPTVGTRPCKNSVVFRSEKINFCALIIIKNDYNLWEYTCLVYK